MISVRDSRCYLSCQLFFFFVCNFSLVFQTANGCFDMIIQLSFNRVLSQSINNSPKIATEIFDSLSQVMSTEISKEFLGIRYSIK